MGIFSGIKKKVQTSVKEFQEGRAEKSAMLRDERTALKEAYKKERMKEVKRVAKLRARRAVEKRYLPKSRPTSDMGSDILSSIIGGPMGPQSHEHSYVRTSRGTLKCKRCGHEIRPENLKPKKKLTIDLDPMEIMFG